MREMSQLAVWRRAHALVLRVYIESKQLPASENFGLTSNLRRSAIAVPKAIAEGCSRDFGQEFVGDLRRARAAAKELEYLILLCRDLGFFAEPVHDELQAELAEVGKMISGLIKRVAAEPAHLVP